MSCEGVSCGEDGGVSLFKCDGVEAWNALLISSGSLPLIISATVPHRMSSSLLMSR